MNPKGLISQRGLRKYIPNYIRSRLRCVHAQLSFKHLALVYVCTYIRLSVPLGCLIKQAGIIIHTILNLWETPGIEPVTSGLTSVY